MAVVKFKLDRERELKRTQRTSFRLSQAGISPNDLSNPDKCFAAVCHWLVALINEPNVKLNAEDVALLIEGRETEAVEAIKECLDIDDAEGDEEKKSGSKGGPSSDSKSA
jgi:hypothetical protein